jgi:hypothetical protein
MQGFPNFFLLVTLNCFYKSRDPVKNKNTTQKILIRGLSDQKIEVIIDFNIGNLFLGILVNLKRVFLVPEPLH